MIIDFAYPFATGQALAGRGVNGVIRYLSSADPGKCATAAELADYHAHGIGTALVFEDTAERARGGRAAGTADGAFARAKAGQVGAPPGATIYAAVDFDVPDYAPDSADAAAKLGPAGQYLAAFFSELGGYYVHGAYGGFWLVKRAYDAGLVRRGWQTMAWSGGQVDDRTALLQAGGQVFSGKADLNFAGWRDWGQYRRETMTVVGAAA